MARRPRQAPAHSPLSAIQIAAATYVGSREHKAERWWGGLPGARLDGNGMARRPKKQHTTICPLVTPEDRECATDRVRAALRSGQYRFLDADRDYPGRIWYRDAEGQVWIGYCINSVRGEYKGWPITEEARRETFG